MSRGETLAAKGRRGVRPNGQGARQSGEEREAFSVVAKKKMDSVKDEQVGFFLLEFFF